MTTALADFGKTVTVGGRKITNIRYADGIVFIFASMSGLIESTNKVQMARKCFLMQEKTKVMKIVADKECYDDQNLTIDGEEVETVSDVCYLGAIFTDRYIDTKEI